MIWYSFFVSAAGMLGSLVLAATLPLGIAAKWSAALLLPSEVVFLTSALIIALTGVTP